MITAFWMTVEDYVKIAKWAPIHEVVPKHIIREQLMQKKWEDYVNKLEAGELFNWNCPLDPFEKLMCTSCQ